MNQTRLRTAWRTAAAYGLLVLIMWGPVGSTNGLSGETCWAYASETRSKIEGFFSPGNPMRVHVNCFYHLAYLLSILLQIKGSFVPYQIVYALLWWARGFLTYLILRRLLPQYSFFNYLVGALVIVHASDAALQWAGILNIMGTMVWMLLAIFFLVLSSQAPRTCWAVGWLASALGFVYLALWTYESPVCILAVAPLIVWLGSRPWPKRFLATASAWYAVLGYYAYATACQYLQTRGQSYQESMLRSDWSLSAILGDGWFNLLASLKFWTWSERAYDWNSLLTRNDLPFTATHLEWFALLAVSVFVGGGIVAWRTRPPAPVPDEGVLPRGRTWLVVGGVGLTLLVLSFPVYLLLDGARTLWRTQFLSGFRRRAGPGLGHQPGRPPLTASLSASGVRSGVRRVHRVPGRHDGP